jgi:hypothetical protein
MSDQIPTEVEGGTRATNEAEELWYEELFKLPLELAKTSRAI